MLDDEKLSHVADWLLGPPLILVLASVANWAGRRRHGRGARSVIKRVADAVWAEDDGVLEEPELWGVKQLGANGVMLRLVVKTTPSPEVS